MGGAPEKAFNHAPHSFHGLSQRRQMFIGLFCVNLSVRAAALFSGA
jgi:hypothetical protein